MARPQKEGLDYFPFDVGFFSDRKIKILKSRYGMDGISVYLYILCEIYRDKGYYIQTDEDFCYTVSDDLNMDFDKIGQIMNFLLGRSLFENTLFKSDKVLTSRGIQVRYQQAIKNRASKKAVDVNEKFWLLSEEETEGYIKVTKNQSFSVKNKGYSVKNDSFSEEKPHKGKESKGKESKVNYQLIADLYNETCVSLPHCTKLSESRKKAIKARLNSGYTYGDFKNLFEKAENSRFLKGGNDRNWKADFDWLLKDSNIAKVLDGRYDDSGSAPPKPSKFNNFSEQEEYDFGRLEKAAMAKLLEEAGT